LVQGENVVELAPVGSLLTQDVIANSVLEIISSSELLQSAPIALVTEIARIVAALPLTSKNVYGEVINNFINRRGLPSVEMVSPLNSQNFKLGAEINFLASATDFDGKVSNVEFYQNSIKIGESATYPYSAKWVPTATGTFKIYAKATDNNLAVSVSSSRIINVIDGIVQRFTLDSNGIITDNKEYKQWYDGYNGQTGIQRNWYQARDWAKSLSVDGGGWRLATRDELKTLYPDAWETGLFKSSWSWSLDIKENTTACYLHLLTSDEYWVDLNNTYFVVLAIRSTKTLENKLTNLSLDPSSTSVVIGNTYDLGKVKVTAAYGDLTTKTVSADLAWSGRGVIGTNFTAPTDTGVVTLDCSYTEGNITKTASFTVEVLKAKLLGLEIKPEVATVTVNSSLDLNELQVTAIYTDDTRRVVTDGLVWSGNGVVDSIFTASKYTSNINLTCAFTENGVIKSAPLLINVVP
jgi:hypothetical protein